MFRLKYAPDSPGGGSEENANNADELLQALQNSDLYENDFDVVDPNAPEVEVKPEIKPSDDKPESKEPVIEPVEGAYLDTRTIVNGKIEGSVYKTKEEFLKGQQELLAHKARVESSDRQAREELARIKAENESLKANKKPNDDPTDALNRVFDDGEDEDDVIDENDPTYKRIFRQLDKTLDDTDLAKKMAWAQTIGAREEAKRYAQGREEQLTEKQRIAEQQQTQVQLIETVNEAATKHPDLLVDIATGAELEKQNIDESHPDYQKLQNTIAFHVMVTSGLSKDFALRKIAGEQQQPKDIEALLADARKKGEEEAYKNLEKQGVRIRTVPGGGSGGPSRTVQAIKYKDMTPEQKAAEQARLAEAHLSNIDLDTD